MSARAVCLLAAAGALLGPSAVLCQAAGANRPQGATEGEQQVFDQRAREAVRDFTIAGQGVMSSGSPNDRASAGFNKPTLQFTGEQDETGVSLAFSLDVDDYDPIETRPNFYRVGRTQLSFVASAPIEGESASRLFAGDSLVAGSKIKLSFSHLSAALGNGAGGAGWRDAAYRACIDANVAIWLERNRSSIANADAIAVRFKSDVGNQRFEGRLEELAQVDNESATPFVPQVAATSVEAVVYNACVPTPRDGALPDEASLVDKYTDKGKTFADLFYDKSSFLTFLGIDGSVGRDDYEYLDRSAFQLANDARTSWEVGAYAGMINTDLTFSARVRAVYGKTYELAEEAEVCRTFADTLEEQCLTGPDGLPLGKENGLISLETRHLFAIDESNRIALAPQVTYRFEDDSFGVEVPVYLSPDKDGKLSGGIKFAYNSKEEDEFGIGVFVGIPFSIFFQ